MAYQHFYSRVPARCSMFKHTDGFDTFAKSAEIGKIFIDRELTQLLEYKTTKYEAALIRDNVLPPAYAQTFSKTGEMIQSCISYMPTDYTGERSCHMIHTLVLTAEEKLFMTSSVDKKTFNEKMFQTDITPFHITYANASPKENYPTVPYTSEKAGPLKDMVDSYNPKVLKHFIFAVINAICGKGKPVFVTLGKPVEELSQAALDFMNTFILILPFNLRRAISFITYQSDYTKFNNYKIHFLPADCMAIPTGKGYLFDMTPKVASGIRDEEYASQEGLVDFFYRIATDNRLRTMFLKYYQGVIDTDPTLEEPNIRTLSAMVTLFRQISGAYSEKALLPDDAKVYDMISVYEKYRKALKASDRSIVYESLRRYPTGHMVIPNNIFSKIAKLYPTEPAKTKNTVMEVILDLLHTDIMREKLFAFIKANYAKESPKNRAEICENLARVYYGGFLQSQILSFFTQYFKGEAESTRDLIIEKILLTIRTPSIQDSVLEFLDTFYDILTDYQKKMLYKTIYEMLPMCDELTEKLIGFMNRHTEGEAETLRTACAEKLASLSESDQKKQEHRLTSTFLSVSGFCRRAILNPLFNRWTNRRVLEEFFEEFFTHTIEDVGGMIVDIFTAVPFMPANAEKKLRHFLTQNMPAFLKKQSFYKLTAFDDLINEKLFGKLNDNVDAIVEYLDGNVIHPAVIGSMLDVFRPNLHPDPIGFVLAYVKAHPYLETCKPFRQVERYLRIQAYLKDGVGEKIAEEMLLFPEDAQHRKNIGVTVNRYLDTLGEAVGETAEKAEAFAIAKILSGYLFGKMTVENVYDALFDCYMNIYINGGTGGKPEEMRSKASGAALLAITCAIVSLRDSALPDESKAWFLLSSSEDGQMPGVMRRAVSGMNGSARKAYRNRLNEVTKQDADCQKAFTTFFLLAKKAAGGGFFSSVLSSIASFFTGIPGFFKGLFRKLFRK